MKEDSPIESWTEVILIYNSALKQISTKLEILNDEFQHVHRYNPIEHIKSRIKSSESIVKKLRRNNLESTIENMVEYVNDIAGIRVICSFSSLSFSKRFESFKALNTSSSEIIMH